MLAIMLVTMLVMMRRLWGTFSAWGADNRGGIVGLCYRALDLPRGRVILYTAWVDNRLTFTPQVTTNYHYYATKQAFERVYAMDKKYLVKAPPTLLSQQPHTITYGDKKILTQPSLAEAYDVAEALSEAHQRGEGEYEMQHAHDHASAVELGDPPPTIPEFTSGEGDRVRAPMGMDTPQPGDYLDYNTPDMTLDDILEHELPVPDHDYPQSCPRDDLTLSDHFEKYDESRKQDDLPSIFPYGVPVPPLNDPNTMDKKYGRYYDPGIKMDFVKDEDMTIERVNGTTEGIVVRDKDEPYRASGDTPPVRIRPTTREYWARTLVPPEPVMPENETVFDTTTETHWRHRLSPFWLGMTLAVLAVTIAVFATIDWSLIWRMTGLSL